MRVSSIGVEDGQRFIKEEPTHPKHISTKQYTDTTAVTAANAAVAAQLSTFQQDITTEMNTLRVDVGAKAAVTLTPGQAADLGLSDYFILTANGNQTITFSNAAALEGKPATIYFDIRNTSSLNLVWSVPNLTMARGLAIILTPNGRDIIGLTTKDGGASWSMGSVLPDVR